MLGRIVATAFALLLAPTAYANSISEIDIDGRAIRLVVPEGHCLLDPDRPMERLMVDMFGQIVGQQYQAHALFITCSELDLFRTDLEALDEVSRLGGYFIPMEADGSPAYVPGLPRTVFAKISADSAETLDNPPTDEEILERIKTATADPTANSTLQYFGSTGHSKDAAYFAMYGTQTSYGTTSTFVGSFGVTLIHQLVVSDGHLRDRRVRIDRKGATGRGVADRSDG